MLEKSLVIYTTLQRADYRKCLVASMIKMNRGYLVLMAACSAIIGVMRSEQGMFKMNLSKFLQGTLVAFCIMVLLGLVAILVDCEHRIRTRLKEKLGKVKTISFYPEYLIREYKELNDTRRIYYDQIYRVVEGRNYICLYYTATAMSAIRRRDMKPEEWERIKKILSMKCSYNG